MTQMGLVLKREGRVPSSKLARCLPIRLSSPTTSSSWDRALPPASFWRPTSSGLPLRLGVGARAGRPCDACRAAGRPRGVRPVHRGERGQREQSEELELHARFGGGSNCWWACTPRMLPVDFELYSRYGVSVDWPLRYDDLEGDYAAVERRMQVAGDSQRSPMPRSLPFPQPPHRLSGAGEILRATFGDQVFAQPRRDRAARAPLARRAAVAGCAACARSMRSSRSPERWRRLLRCARRAAFGRAALLVDTRWASRAGFGSSKAGASDFARAELVGIGANAIFNAAPAAAIRARRRARRRGSHRAGVRDGGRDPRALPAARVHQHQRSRLHALTTVRTAPRARVPCSRS